MVLRRQLQPGPKGLMPSTSRAPKLLPIGSRRRGRGESCPPQSSSSRGMSFRRQRPERAALQTSLFPTNAVSDLLVVAERILRVLVFGVPI